MGVFAALATAPGGVAADDGVTRDEVAFAQVAALEGPAAELGRGMRQGVLAAFEEANRAGGVHGRRLTLDSRDDGYEPDRSIVQTRAMIESGAYIGFIAPVGTPTTKATQPIAAAAGMAVIGPFTGAGFLRDESVGNVFNVRASYAAEARSGVRHLVETRGAERIAVLYQDDAFGRAGLEGVEAALAARDMRLAAKGVYVRNTLAVKAALLKIRLAEADAVVMVGAYKPVAEFVRVARKINFEPIFAALSFVGAGALAAELGPAAEGVIVCQVTPSPYVGDPPVVAAYRAALSALDEAAEPGFVSLEGYLAGRLAIAALRAAGPDPTRRGLLDALSHLSVLDLGGVTLRFGGDNRGVDRVFLTRIGPDGALEPIVADDGGDP